ncbi:MAG: hypothetical protein H0W40_09210 [Methylibium sp.]|uniref:hypothetical protein n=1 Tax=Methylibium sp. TaxID=2067992 RepID=UPI001834EB07|nr:hypothetical protein [Methylibium sp.]MBA3597544.1 hypothetical protein [Methylibium sp.]
MTASSPAGEPEPLRLGVVPEPLVLPLDEPLMLPSEDWPFMVPVVVFSRWLGAVTVSSPAGEPEPLRLGAVPELLVLPLDEPLMLPSEDWPFMVPVAVFSRWLGAVTVSSPPGEPEPLRLGAVPEPLVLPLDEPLMLPSEDWPFMVPVVVFSRWLGAVTVSSPAGEPEPLRLVVVPAAPLEAPAVVASLPEPCFMLPSPAWRAGAKARQMVAARAVAWNFIAMLLSKMEKGPNRLGVRLNL